MNVHFGIPFLLKQLSKYEQHSQQILMLIDNLLSIKLKEDEYQSIEQWLQNENVEGCLKSSLINRIQWSINEKFNHIFSIAFPQVLLSIIHHFTSPFSLQQSAIALLITIHSNHNISPFLFSPPITYNNDTPFQQILIQSQQPLHKSKNIKQLSLNIDKVNEQYSFGGEKGKKHCNKEDEIIFIEELKEMAKTCVEYMNGTRLKEEEDIFQHKMPSSRHHNYNTQYHQDNNNHNPNIPLTTKPTNDKIKFNLKINDLDIIHENNQNQNLIKKKSNSFINNPQPKSFKNQLKSESFVDACVTSKAKNESIRFKTLQFIKEMEPKEIIIDKKQKEEQQKRDYEQQLQKSGLYVMYMEWLLGLPFGKEFFINDRINIKNVFVIDLLIHYFKLTSQEEQNRMISDIFLLVKKNKENQIMLFQQQLFVELLVEQSEKEIKEVRHLIITMVCLLVGHKPDILLILDTNCQTKVLESLLDKMKPKEVVEYFYQFSESHCKEYKLDQQANLIRLAVDSQIDNIQKYLLIKQPEECFNDYLNNIKYNLQADKLYHIEQLSDEYLQNGEIQKLLKISNNEQVVMIVKYLMISFEQLDNNGEERVGLLVLQQLKHLEDATEWTMVESLFIFWFVLVDYKNYSSNNFTFIQKYFTIDTETIISKEIIQQLVIEQGSQIGLMIQQDTYQNIIKNNTLLDSFLITQQMESQNELYDLFIKKENHQKKFKQKLNNIREEQEQKKRMEKVEREEVIQKIKKERESQDEKDMMSIDEEERRRESKWHDLWKSLRLCNGAYNLPIFSLQNDDPALFSSPPCPDYSQYRSIKLSKYSFLNGQKALLKIKLKESILLQAQGSQIELQTIRSHSDNQPKEKKKRGLLNILNKMMIPLKSPPKEQSHQGSWVKVLTCRKGTISIEGNDLVFLLESSKQKDDHVSLMGHEHQKHRMMQRKWPIADIMEVYRKRYLMRKQAVQLLFKDGNAILFDMYSQETAKEFTTQLKSLQKHKQKEQCLIRPSLSLEQSTHKWLEYKMSTFDYLMSLNESSQRSHRDISQHPIMPWVIQQYLSQSLDLSDPSLYRPLDKNMGSLGLQERQEYFHSKYESSIDAKHPGGQPYHYGSHYSNPGVVLFYLLRIQPYNKANQLLQGGKYDLPDRLFTSVHSTYMTATDDTQDVRELIPEFYSLPELFINLDHSPFGLTQEVIPVHHVYLPPYAHHSPFLFVSLLRKALESDIVSNALHAWIDLIWGYKQKGKEAIINQNLFYPTTYQHNSPSSLHDFQQKLSYESQIVNFGQTPQQLFKEPHPSRKINNQSRTTLQLDIIQNNKAFQGIESKENDTIMIKCLGDKKIISIKRNGSIKVQSYQSSKLEGEKKKRKKISIMESESIDRSLKMPMAMLNQKWLAIGGFWKGEMMIVNLDDSQVNQRVTVGEENVSCIEYSEREGQLMVGDRGGILTIYNVRIEKMSVMLERVLRVQNQFSCIRCICIRSDMRLIAIGSDDGIVILLSLHSFKSLHCLRIHSPIQSLLLSISPLPTILIHTSQHLFSYSINLQLLQKIQSQSTHMTIITHYNSIEYLLISTLSGQVLIRDIPQLALIQCHQVLSSPIHTLSTHNQFIYIGSTNDHLAILKHNYC